MPTTLYLMSTMESRQAVRVCALFNRCVDREGDTHHLCKVQSRITCTRVPRLGGCTVMHATRFWHWILRTLYSFFMIFRKEFNGILCFWVWETQKKIIVKHNHLSINKQVSIGSGHGDVAQIQWTLLSNLWIWFQYCSLFLRSVIWKLFIIKVYTVR